MGKEEEIIRESNEEDVLYCDYCGEKIDYNKDFISISLDLYKYNKSIKIHDWELIEDHGVYHKECYNKVTMLLVLGHKNNSKIVLGENYSIEGYFNLNKILSDIMENDITNRLKELSDYAMKEIEGGSIKTSLDNDKEFQSELEKIKKECDRPKK